MNDRGRRAAEDIFHDAVEIHPSERDALLDTECGNDAALRREVESLLDVFDRGIRFVDQGPAPAFLDGLESTPDSPGQDRGSVESLERFGPYDLVEEVGHGGQGKVYRAWDARLQRWVALKVLTSFALFQPEAQRRFEREARLAAKIEHPGICAVHEAGTVGATPYIAMQLIEGESLADRLTRARETSQRSGLSLPIILDPGDEAGRDENSTVSSPSERRSRIQSLLRLFEEAARALHAAHEMGLVHRDVKPSNLMVNSDGRPVILDFGLARDLAGDEPTLTVTGDQLGTPFYMSPEQIEGRGSIDQRTDVYSLGVSLFECLTLARPFEAPTREALYQRILHSQAGDPRRLEPTISRDLAVVLETAMARDPNHRYQTALDFAEDLSHVRGYEPIHARPAGPILRAKRWAQRNPSLASALMAIFLILCIALGVSLDLLARRNVALEEQRALLLAAAAREAGETDDALGVRLLLEAVMTSQDPAILSPLHELYGRLRERSIVHVGGQVVCARLSPGGSHCLVVNWKSDQTAHLLDGDGNYLRALAGTDPNVVEARFSPDGRRFLLVRPGSVTIHDLEGDELDRIEHEEIRGQFTVDFLPDSSRIVTGCRDGRVRIWDLQGKLLWEAIASEYPVGSVAVSPIGDRIATGVWRDGSVQLWHEGTEGWRQVGDSIAAHLSLVNHLAFSPDGRWLVSATGWTGGHVGLRSDRAPRVWRAEDGSEVCRLEGHDNNIADLAFSPAHEARLVTTGDDGMVWVWTLPSGEGRLLHEDRSRSFPRVRFTPDGEQLFLPSLAGDVFILDYDTGREIGRLRARSSNAWWVESISHGGDFVLVTGGGDGTVRRWSLLPELPVYGGHDSQVRAARFVGTDRVATVTHLGGVYLWSAEGELLDSHHDETVQYHEAAVAQDGRWLVAVGNRGRQGLVRVVRIEGEQLVEERVVLPDETFQVLAVAINPVVPSEFAIGAGRDLRVYSRNGEPLRCYTGAIRLASVAYSHDGARIAGIDLVGPVFVWEREGELDAPVRRFELPHRSWYGAFSPDGQSLAVGCQDGRIYLYDLSLDENQKPGHLDGHRSQIRVLRYSKDGILASTGDDGTRLWDRDGNLVMVYREPGPEVWSIDFSPEGNRLIEARFDGTARVLITNPVELIRRATERVAFRVLTESERDAYRELLER